MTLPLAVNPFLFALTMTFGAAAIRGLTGFGMAIILVPLLGLVIEPAQAVVVAILLQLFIGPVGIGKIHADAETASAIPIAVIAMLATPLGLWALGVTAPDLARLLIALIAIGAFLLVLLPAREGAVPGRLEVALTGIAAGILTGFAAMPGPPVVPFYLRRKLPPVVSRASMLLIFFATAIAGTLSAIALGSVDWAILLLSALLFPAVLVGNWMGTKAFGTISEPVWRSIVGVLLGVAGIAAVVRLAT
ncbi:sulfite exporter TauE/SafE family protein [Sphingorhabdus sp.]|jgi:uncharacterized membrane protein YfcA|uniref:sulfite exporter TauE/SafE family protein n=1 Tax=Sphingorhabdus sp. TaxID=1902408 RepID=UPI001B499406|nr:sulfite exporter TauE/SafE family protein [Sphingomonadales bacterium]MBK9431378.1 sulfite exporter TauE/SafE family protein [Sphingomonadales bacterium]MBL0022717.1 sulfite exporter TauE/SafE family protein [Sphingomonadales bacterium]MBP6434616.1 sulfite exporter TauE/SafE family protein [Sphingorhabdus sp.]